MSFEERSIKFDDANPADYRAPHLKSKSTPIYTAASTSPAALAEALHVYGRRAVNAEEGCPDRPPLCIAAAAGDHAAVEALLAAGAHPDSAPIASELPALYFAARARSNQCVALLLRAGADPNLAGGGDERPLHALFSEPRPGVDGDGSEFVPSLRSTLSCLRLLLSAGADPNVTTSWACHTPLSLACTSFSSEPATQSSSPLSAVPLLARFAADPHLPGPSGACPADAAAARGDSVAVAMMALCYPDEDFTSPAAAARVADSVGAENGARADGEGVHPRPRARARAPRGAPSPAARAASVSAFLSALGQRAWGRALVAAVAVAEEGASEGGAGAEEGESVFPRAQGRSEVRTQQEQAGVDDDTESLIDFAGRELVKRVATGPPVAAAPGE